jgi:hypothetical protein
MRYRRVCCPVGRFYLEKCMSSFIVEDKGGSFESTPSGMHLARCYRIIDLGTQKSEYMGVSKLLHKIMLGWEIHGVNDDGSPIRMKDGRPFAMFKNYTFSWAEKANLRADLQSWRGKPFTQEEMRRFDLKNVLGAWCMLNVIEKPGSDNKMYVNVAGVSPVPAVIKNSGLPAAINTNEMFTLAEPDMVMFQSFSDNLKKKIMASPEWEKLQGKIKKEDQPDTGASFEDDDSIPF